MRRPRLFGPFGRAPRKPLNRRLSSLRAGDIPLQLSAIAAATLVLLSSCDASVLVQGDSASTLPLQASSAAVAPVQTASAVQLVLLSSESATDPVQAGEAGSLILGLVADATTPDNADANTALAVNSSADGSVIDSAVGAVVVSLSASSDVVTAVLTADADSLLGLQLASNLHNDAPVLIVGGGSRYERRPRKAKPIESLVPAICATATAELVLVGDSSVQTETGAESVSHLSIAASGVARRGADPMEALLFLIVA